MDLEVLIRGLIGDAGHRAALGLLDSGGQPPTAIFAANDIIALGAYNALQCRGIGIPDAITLIGFDDVRLARWEVFRLTTVRQDLPALVRAATELLLSRLAAGTETSLPPRRVARIPN
jgi:LacI family transcriptional regulator